MAGGLLGGLVEGFTSADQQIAVDKQTELYKGQAQFENTLRPGNAPPGAELQPALQTNFSSGHTPAVGGKGLYRESFDANAITNMIQEQVKNSNTSIDPKYFTQTAYIESRFNPKAGSMTGAQGLFQFTKGTWGKRQADRHDPVANTQAAIELAEQNKRYLQSKLGRPPSNAEIYMAHNIGAGGAIRLLTASPDATVTQGLIGSNPAHNPMYLMGKGSNISASEAIRRYRRDFGE